MAAQTAPIATFCRVSLQVRARKARLPYYLVRDAGHTQIPSGSLTVVAVGPGATDQVDTVTGSLSLL